MNESRVQIMAPIVPVSGVVEGVSVVVPAYNEREAGPFRPDPQAHKLISVMVLGTGGLRR